MKAMNTQILLLFGLGNDAESLRLFARKNNLFPFMRIGILQLPDETEVEKYYELFDPEIDPRIFIYKEGKPLFIESLENREFISFEYLMKLLGS